MIQKNTHRYLRKHWYIQMYRIVKSVQFYQRQAHLAYVHDMNLPDQMLVMDLKRMAIDSGTLDYLPSYCCVTSSDEMNHLDW